jgi:electron transfer flavoprotein beta subunit
MHTIVCVKQIAYTYARTGRELDRHYLSKDDVVCRINPYDELAAAAALGAAELGGGDISLLTLGPLIAERELRRCAAFGVKSLYQIDTTATMDPWQKSVLLSRAIQKIGADLVLCGKESLDTRNGQVGALLGYALNRPFVSGIRDFHQVSMEKGLVVERSAGRGKREMVRCMLPAVCSVDAGSILLPHPTHDQMEKSRKLPITRLMFDENAVQPKCLRTGIGPPRPRPKAPAPPSSRLNAYERTSALLTGSRLEKKGEMLTGSINSQVEGFISFLKANDFLESTRGKSEG